MFALFTVLFYTPPKQSMAKSNGVYVYDNGSDTIIGFSNKVLSEEVDKKLEELGIVKKDGESCLPASIFPMEGSTYLHFIALNSKMTSGYMESSCCRDTFYTNKILNRLKRQVEGSDWYPKNDLQKIKVISIKNDSTFEFYVGGSGLVTEHFVCTVKDNGDRIDVLYSNADLGVVNAPTEKRRVYKFYPYLIH